MTRVLAFAAMFIMLLAGASAQQPGMGGGGGVPITSGTPPSGGQAPGSQPPVAQPGARPGGQNSQIPGAGLVSIARLETRTTSIGVAGRLEPARRIGHTVSIAGFVETIHVRVGERVTEGQSLVTLSRDVPGEVFRPMVVASRITGRVSEIHLMEGEEVKSGTTAVTVMDDAEFRLVAALSDKDAFRVTSMGRASVTARSADGMILQGSLESVAAEPDYSTGLFSATLRFPAQAGTRIGMVLFMDLPVDSVRGQFVKQDLIVRRFGHSVMWTIDADDKLKQVQVTTGKPYGDEILVTGGLPPGTRYLNRLGGSEREGLSLQEYLAALRKDS
ncbi:MAG: HlyD family efflux transporter periplasmic adaptor subunit [Spirochaetia bacterium]|nr:HlyD family efflux transporter periplasmic adaptor subunit [Spirochaetia bacterium]